jgi:hypothetical protein
MMTMALRNVLIEVTIAAIVTVGLAGLIEDLPAWGYVMAIFAGLGMGTLVASTTRPAASEVA